MPEFQLSAPAQITLATEADPSAGPADDGRFTAIVGVLNQRIPRMAFDIVLRPGCADRSLQERGLPSMLYAHDMAGAVIGTCESFIEEDNVFRAEGQLFADATRRVQLAYETWIAMTARNGDGRTALREFSLGFDVNDAAWEMIDGDEVLAMTDITVFEFSPVVVAAARGTGFLSADPSLDDLLKRFPRAQLADDAVIDTPSPPTPTPAPSPSPAPPVPTPQPAPTPTPQPDPPPFDPPNQPDPPDADEPDTLDDAEPVTAASLEDRRRVAAVLFG